MRTIVTAVLLTLTAPASYSDVIIGNARVLDGDTIKIGSQVVRLHGIDAPENDQYCERDGKNYNCGAVAENALRTLVSGDVTCYGDVQDRYQRLIAVCQSEGRNINRQMVKTGHALAFRRFSTDYVTEELTAMEAKVGIWAGTFEAPWDFRAERWANASPDAPSSGCPIKGNINSKGERIYHTPWSKSYKRTKINEAKFERWFCTEAEALAAGWRAPYR